MRVILSGKGLKQCLRWMQWSLFATAVGTLGYAGFALADSQMFQAEERRRLDGLLRARVEVSAGKAASHRDLRHSKEGALIGRIEIPRVGVSVVVVEGTSTRSLRRAVGHIGGTALPGEPGNSAISGHRDTFFRPLRNIRKDDEITVTTLVGEYRYRVEWTRVVGKQEVAVLDPTASEVLTLVTCYPFYLVGSAPKRFIVRAVRVEGSE
jgi:sortase A